MEFELERTGWDGFETVLDTTLRTEETMEMIVPDNCPDILRVCETDGQVLITGKETADGRAEVTGCMKLWALYIPDGESGTRRLEVTIPFTCGVDNADITNGCCVVASARLCRADTRALNPRKVLVRAEAAVEVTVYCPKAENICSRVSAAEEQGMEQLTETREVYPVVWVKEKPFPISEDITLPGSRPAAVELLKCRVWPVGGESKIIGNKLIFKGSINVFLLYRGEDDGVWSASAELPFSQIMEVSGVSEEADRDITLCVTEAQCALNANDDGRTVSVSAQVVAQAVIRENRSLTVLADAYSTAGNVEVDFETCPMDTKVDRGVRTQNVREVWETQSPVREVTDCRVTVEEVTQSREGDRLVLTAQVGVELLYADEEGGLFAARWTVSVPCALELPEGCRCIPRCEPVGDVYAAPAAGGVEVRFALDFRFCATARQPITAVSGLREGEAPQVSGEQPSLVLRMLEPGERLWDMAKTCGTTISDIISANELPDESAAAGKLLLIPRRR